SSSVRFPRDDERSLLSRDIRFRRPRAALLYRRRRLVGFAHLHDSAALSAGHGQAHGGNGAEGRGSHQLEVLTFFLGCRKYISAAFSRYLRRYSGTWERAARIFAIVWGVL